MASYDLSFEVGDSLFSSILGFNESIILVSFFFFFFFLTFFGGDLGRGGLRELYGN